MCVCEYSTDAVKYSCHRPSLCPPLFFILARSMGKNKLASIYFRAHDGLFFFFSTFYDICCTDACMCTRLSVWLHYFWILLSYFADFFFSRKRDGFSREKGKFSWRLVYGQKVSTVRWEFYRATGCLIAEGRDANGFKLINESYTVYNIYICYIYMYMYIRKFKRFKNSE